MDNNALVIEQEYNAPIDLVWRALTENELLEKWYFKLTDFKPEVGCKFQFEGGTEDRRYMHLCEVLEVIPQEKIKYTWTYEGYPGVSYVTFELVPAGKKTKVTLIHEGIETFTNPDFKRENFVGGWKYLIDESFKAYLEEGKALRNW